ncbi:MAG: CHRD domain-containing protein [Bacteroidetes bacterium]|nr:CHRD domain-containing protein [Bacteroidota bacterium]
MQQISLFVKTFLMMTFMLFLSKNSSATLYSINVPINSAQEVPSNPSTGTGTLTGTYDDVTNTLVISVSFSGLSGNSTASHFHGPAAVGVNAGVRIGLTGFPTGVTSGNYSNTFVLSASNETELLNNLWYQNIHSTVYPGGEIRGQVYATPISFLNLSACIEGLYDSGLNTSVRDTLRVNLRQGTSPYSLVESGKVYMKSNGNDSVKYFTASNSVNYYLQLVHRNGIETWSSNPVSFSSYYVAYDFSDSDTKAYGNNQVLKGSKYCIYSGDVNADGIVDIADLSSIDNDANNFISGYVSTDLNGDSFIDLNDLSVCDNNAANIVSLMRP